jgi:asparagine synthase (glutamine-hydrolysing)
MGLALQMAARIQSRGPDDHGDWHNHDGTLALSHRRLSIVDLSPAGHQPMVAEFGQHALVYNGEIYNHEDLRKELEIELGQISWKGHSDTEVLLHCLQHWGVETTLGKLNGMFAFCYWCEREQALYLARDRMGEKPLYFGRHNDTFFFGSELKALRAHPKFSAQVDRDALALYMRHNYIPAPYSIYQDVHKLKAAHFIVVKEHGQEISNQRCYWDLVQVAKKGLDNPVLNETESLEELDGLLRDSVKRRMMADVPLGAFLSGGYDSTIVTALMQSMSSKPVKTFSIGFSEDAFNEAHHAKQVASYLGTEHTELYVEPQQSMDVIPRLPEVYDEPFSDSSQIPTFLVSQMAKRHVTVALSGDGGDELFCGYERYFSHNQVWSIVGKLPRSFRPLLAGAIAHFPGKLADLLVRGLPRKYHLENLGDRLPKLADWVNNSDFEGYYQNAVSRSRSSQKMVRGSRSTPYPTDFERLAGVISCLRDQEKMMLLDALTYLPGDILTKVDRASMAVSLEARVPLLDHRLVEYSWRLPLEMKINYGDAKWPLRQVLYKYVPREMMERPKKGFGIPIEHWLSGPLRDWAESLLAETRLKQDGFFDPVPIRKMWQEHLQGKRRWHAHLWDVLMFQGWLDRESM